ncbi:MAG: sodium:proton antiporter [Acidobacteria bacterium]|nr:MAG: sodium:proton antiporter [Acidobacteriota bacterium]MCE7958539.1 sodium:proton antiporter [Acidobacteria bacterium ACB2]
MTPLGWAVPFALLLLAIAVFPLALPRLWERLWFQAAVAAACSAPVLVRLLAHEPATLGAVLHEYGSFILMLGALYVVSSGIVLDGDLRATPLTNAGILLLGAALASFIGTTGASMLTIRPLLSTNAERTRSVHSVCFFILLVSNAGGLLTPLGDPPLFIGYLRGVPFLWTLRLFPIWVLVVGALLLVYVAVDSWHYRREPMAARLQDAMEREPLRLRGGGNLLLLAAVVAATALLRSPFREGAYVSLAALSFVVTPRGLRSETRYSWGPILEVAALFAGIFVAMEPALAILSERAPTLGVTEPWQFFWATGALSSFLDNAPTYAAFLALAQGLGRPEVAGAPAEALAAVSAGAVLFGAMTYIGNGPNFLVRGIAERRGVRMPSFFGYMGFAALVLLPLFGLVTVLFFRPGSP